MPDQLPACFVISLDFELMWGIRDKRGAAHYRGNILGVRQAVPAMLALFRRYEVAATWAAVGLLLFDQKPRPLRDRTTIVVTSDHGFRGAEVAGVAPDHKVPFAVLFPSRTPTLWEEPLYTVPLRPLSIALLRGELRSGDDLRQWLHQRTRSP